MSKILLYFHAGSHNHGCEAIVRSTSAILNRYLGDDTTIYLASKKTDSDYKYGIDKVGVDIRSSTAPSKMGEGFWRYADALTSRTVGNAISLEKRNRPTLDLAMNSDIAFSIGGDNYSENNGVVLSRIDMLIRRRCSKSVLFGASLDSRWLDPEKNKIKIDNLRQFSLIVARESLTYDALTKLGLENVRLYPDPAFIMPAAETAEPLFPENTVGINISPLIQRFQKDKNIILANYTELVKYILDKTDMDIALIPHVVSPVGASDFGAIEALMRRLPDNPRIHRVPDSDTMTLKAHISRCRFFVGARTHSTIAAYSTGVPTIVAGYSVKAKGIAKDLFGTDENFVVPVQNMSKPTELRDAFMLLAAHEVDIRSHLVRHMPAYIERAWQVGEEIQRLALQP